MSYELLIALRYLRAKRRHRTISLNTAISIGGVTLGVAALIATLAVMTGFKEDLRDKILGTNSHIVITDRLGDGLADYRETIEHVLEIPHVVAATPFIYNQVLLSTPSGVHGVILRGIDPATEGEVTQLEKNLVQGKLEDLVALESLSSDNQSERPTGIILGRELANRLGVFPGDQVNVISPAGTPGPLGIIPKIRTFRLVGIFEAGMYEYDSSLAYINLTAAQDFFNLGNTVTGVEVKLDDIFLANRIVQTIESELGLSYRVRDWMEMNRNLFSALKLEKIMMFIILVLIILVASFNIVGTLTMIVIEKNREIAFLKAMGAKSGAIMRIFMIDGLIIGLVGALIGIPLGYTICWGIESFYTLPADVYYISHIPVKMRLTDIISVALAAIGISFLATLYPSWQAGKLRPAEGLRYE
jgi:lipoprotein-releasing system permease protein